MLHKAGPEKWQTKGAGVTSTSERILQGRGSARYEEREIKILLRLKKLTLGWLACSAWLWFLPAAIYKSKMCKREATERSKEIDAVRDWLRANREWLLIIDNVAPKDVMQYLPGGRGHILFTSRNPDWTDFTQLVGLMEWKSKE